MRADIEVHEIIMGAFFSVFSLVQVNLIEQSTILGFDLLGSVHTFTGGGDTASITPAMLGMIVILAFTMYSNDWSPSLYAGMDIWIIVVTVWLIIAPPFVPILEAMIETSMLPGLVAFLIQVVGYGSASYLQ
jgi:hypothetical protein